MNPLKNKRIPAWWSHAETIVAKYSENKAELEQLKDNVIERQGTNKVPELSRTDVTGERAIKIASDRRICHLTDCVAAVDFALGETKRIEKDKAALAVRNRIIEQLYWRGHESYYQSRYHIRLIAQDCHISERLAQMYRHQFLVLVAYQMGWTDGEGYGLKLSKKKAPSLC